MKQQPEPIDIYVESNFVLELALLQEQCESCERLIELAETGKVRLIVPAYSLLEPYEKLGRQANQRLTLSNALNAEIKQLSRSTPYQNEMDTMQHVSGVLVRSSAEEKERLRRAVDRILAVAETIELDTQILRSANTYQLHLPLSPQDAVVYASVLSHLSTSTATAKCFLNKNSKDFDDPDIEEQLNTYSCKMLFSFDRGYQYVIRAKKHA